MTILLCDWCGEPAEPGQELCRNCLIAQKNADGAEVPAMPIQAKPEKSTSSPSTAAKVWYWTRYTFLVASKVVGLFVLGSVMVLAGITGTCGLLIASGSVFNSAMSWGPLLLALFGFGIAYVMVRLMISMSRIQMQPLQDSQAPELEIAAAQAGIVSESKPAAEFSEPASMSRHSGDSGTETDTASESMEPSGNEGESSGRNKVDPDNDRPSEP